jgi:hypothetical protein
MGDVRLCATITLIAGTALAGLGLPHALEHNDGAQRRDHHHHIHTHSHGGYVHTHVHSHSTHEEYSSGGSGSDHHECSDGHDEPTPVLLNATSRDTRRSSENDLIGFGLAVAPVRAPDSSGPAAPERPPPRPTRQDPLPQLRTIVLVI